MTLAEYLEGYLGGLADQLGWNSNSYTFVVAEALRLYGVSSEDQATDLNKLYALARVALWEAVLREVSMDFDYSANGANFRRSQVYEQVRQNLEDARADAQMYLGDYAVGTGILDEDRFDPYSNRPYSMR